MRMIKYSKVCHHPAWLVIRPRSAMAPLVLTVVAIAFTGCVQTFDSRKTSPHDPSQGEIANNSQSQGVVITKSGSIDFRADAPDARFASEPRRRLGLIGVQAGAMGGRGATGIPGSLLSAHEELWVIAQTRSISNPSRQQEPNSGAMCVKVDDELIAMPLKHTDVKAEILGYIASVKVAQQFQNPYDSKIEAVYVFPLPENAAVNEFVMTIGERRIRAIIRERKEAEQIYSEAKRQG